MKFDCILVKMADSDGDHFSLGDFPEIVVESDSDLETEVCLETKVCQVCYLSTVMCNDFKKVLGIRFHLFVSGS